MGRDVGRGKVAYIWICPNPTKAGPTLGGVVVIVVVILQRNTPKFDVPKCKLP